MSNAVELFDYHGSSVRTLLIDGELWFVVADVCAILGISNPSQAVSYLDADEYKTTLISSEGGQQRPANVVNEAGLYSLILRSRKPEAKAFKRWITHEVLPQIRRTGSYGTPALPDLTTATGVLALAEQLTATARQLVAAEAKVAELEPKAAAVDALTEVDGTLSIGAVANMFGIGRTTLFRVLRKEKILQPDRRPYQPYAAWFRVAMTTWTAKDGTTGVSHTSYLWPAGAARLHALLTRRGHQLRPLPDTSLPATRTAS